jgi:hypothetical protein
MKKDLAQVKKNMEYLAKIKTAKGCSNCGYKKHPAALEFHHLQNKKHNISRIAHRGVSQNILDEEIKKCVVICSNCHKELHFIIE